MSGESDFKRSERTTLIGLLLGKAARDRPKLPASLIVRKAANLIHPGSPYRQCLDLVIYMAEHGRPPADVMKAVEDRWHLEYPGTNNAVANGGIVAASVWFGGGNFLDTVNLAIGMFMPPFGLNLFASHALFGTPLPKLYRGVLPFLVIYLLMLLLITYVPAITLLPLRLLW